MKHYIAPWRDDRSSDEDSTLQQSEDGQGAKEGYDHEGAGVLGIRPIKSSLWRENVIQSDSSEESETTVKHTNTTKEKENENSGEVVIWQKRYCNHQVQPCTIFLFVAFLLFAVAGLSIAVLRGRESTDSSESINATLQDGDMVNVWPTAHPSVMRTRTPTMTTPPRSFSFFPSPVGSSTTLSPSSEQPLQNPELTPTVQLPALDPKPIVTARPTMSPNQCVKSFVSVDQYCYVGNDDYIFFQFQNCKPRKKDWIGIWFEGDNPQDPTTKYVAWVWTCGTQTCNGSPPTGIFAFETNGFSFSQYRAYLVRYNATNNNNNATTKNDYFNVIQASSDSFIVTNICD